MRICQLPPMLRSPLALKCPFPSGSRLILSVPISISSIVVYSDTPTFVVGLPVLLSTTFTVNTLVPKRFGLTLNMIVNLLSVVFTVVLYGLAFAVVCCCCVVAVGERVPANTFIGLKNRGLRRAKALFGQALGYTTCTSRVWCEGAKPNTV